MSKNRDTSELLSSDFYRLSFLSRRWDRRHYSESIESSRIVGLILGSGAIGRWRCVYWDVCMHACMRVCMHACTHVCMHACMHACVAMLWWEGAWQCRVTVVHFFSFTFLSVRTFGRDVNGTRYTQLRGGGEAGMREGIRLVLVLNLRGVGLVLQVKFWDTEVVVYIMHASYKSVHMHVCMHACKKKPSRRDDVQCVLNACMSACLY